MVSNSCIKMDIKVIENKKNRLVVEIPGEGHTLCNLVTKYAWSEGSVTASGYNIEHPLVSAPKVVISTSKGDAKEAAISAAKKAKKDLSDFESKFKKLRI